MLCNKKKMKRIGQRQHLKMLRSQSNENLSCARLVLAKKYVDNHENARSAHLDYAIALMELSSMNRNLYNTTLNPKQNIWFFVSLVVEFKVRDIAPVPGMFCSG